MALTVAIQMDPVERIDISADSTFALHGLRRRGREAVCLYGPRDLTLRGGTVTFNVLDTAGRPIDFSLVERAARDRGVAIRAGCFCNPGAAEHAFGFDAQRARTCLRTASERGFTIERFAECMSDASAVGALRASVGVATNERDIDRLLELIDSMSKR